MRTKSPLTFLLLLVTLSTTQGFAQKDEMVVGETENCLATTAGSTVILPIYVRDVSGSPLGADRPAGKRIQGISFQIVYSPTQAVSQIRLFRAGILKNLTPITELGPSSPGAVAYIGLFDEHFNPIPFRLDAPDRGDIIMELHVSLAAGASPGTVVDLRFGPSTTTALTDQGGLTSETVDNGWLTLKNGCIRISEGRRRAVRKP